MTDRAHPAPQRHYVSMAPLALTLIAVPCMWGLRLIVNFGIDSHFCFPGESRHDALPSWAWPTLLGIDLLAALAAAIAAGFAFRAWRLTRAELEESRAPLIELGEGRTRFLSLWGFMIGLGFLIAIGFDLIGLWIVPTCG